MIDASFRRAKTFTQCVAAHRSSASRRRGETLVNAAADVTIGGQSFHSCFDVKASASC
jgi:hypothetical protein